jgi:hypothetical protein
VSSKNFSPRAADAVDHRVEPRIDDVEPPRGFGQLHYANVAGWRRGDHAELEKLRQAVGRLVVGLVKPEDRWLSLGVQTAVELFRRAPAAMGSLAVALREVYGI